MERKRSVAARWAVCLVGWIMVLQACGPAVAQPAAPPAVPLLAEAFYRRPDIERMALSPSGRWLAMTTAASGQRTGLIVFDLQKWQPLALVARFGDADINDFWWVNDDRLVYDIIDRSRGSGDQRWWPGLFSVHRDGSGQRQLVKLAREYVVNERRVRAEPLEPHHLLLHVPVGGGDEVVVGEWKYADTGEFTGVIAKRLNVVTGRTTTLSAGAPPFVTNWFFDPQGEPRVVVTRQKGRSTVLWRAPGRDDWKPLAEAGSFEMPFWPHGVDSDGQLYVTVSGSGSGFSVLKRFDFATGQPAKDALVSTPGFDFNGRVFGETEGSRALGVRVITDAETTVWFDKRLAALQQEADRRLPGRVNRLACRRCDAPDMTVVVHSYSDRDPGQFWIHTSEDGRWRAVGNRRSGIDPRRMGTTDFERVRMRDGLEIPVWITRPAEPATGPRPTVLLVHGGPWARGRDWSWNADAQFLASRGYVVIEPEFRGSTGYGRELERAGWKQWGRGMQDDLVEALAWAVGKGIADPKKVCIAGASYGGYAALMGLARDGELFRCGVAWVAVTDPRQLFEWSWTSDVSEESRQYDLPRLIGDPVADADALAKVTPVLLADRIRAPLLLAFGALDRRVPRDSGQRMRDALARAGRPPEWVLYDDEGHGWLKLETRIDFALRLEAFLARHLK